MRKIFSRNLEQRVAKVCILDYGSGNVRSVMNAFSNFSDCVISNELNIIKNASHIVLPGVGSYKNSMELIQKRIPIADLKNYLSAGKPFLGICVGMQVLGIKGIEFEEAPGLELMPGIVSRINSGNLPLPHVGWNNLIDLKENPLTSGITEEDDFYFVHSFAYTNLGEEHVLAKVLYGQTFPAIVSSKNIFGVQFHPEKSQKAGLRVIQNFLEIV